MNLFELLFLVLALTLSVWSGKHLFGLIGWWAVVPAPVIGFGSMLLLLVVLKRLFGRSYQITLTARNEGLEYRDRHDVYRFSVRLSGNVWTLFLPGTKGERFERHVLDQQEQATILPRITKYLSHVRWLGVYGRSYSVLIQDEQQR